MVDKDDPELLKIILALNLFELQRVKRSRGESCDLEELTGLSLPILRSWSEGEGPSYRDEVTRQVSEKLGIEASVLLTDHDVNDEDLDVTDITKRRRATALKAALDVALKKHKTTGGCRGQG